MNKCLADVAVLGVATAITLPTVVLYVRRKLLRCTVLYMLLALFRSYILIPRCDNGFEMLYCYRNAISKVTILITSINQYLSTYCVQGHSLILIRYAYLLLAMVPGYPAAVRVWNRTGWSSPGCYPENMGTHRVRGWIWTGPRFHCMVPTTFAAIKYFNSHRIATWSIYEMCRSMP